MPGRCLRTAYEQLEVLGGRAKRWFGRCPDCLERCSKLYLPPGNARFGCRRCLDLSYESRQRSHSGVRALRNDHALCSAIIASPIPSSPSGQSRFWNAMRALPSSRDKGAGRVPWKAWRLYYLAEGLASGELQRLKVEMEDGSEKVAN